MKSIYISLLSLILLASCVTKNLTPAEEPTPPAERALGTFTWTENGGASQLADSSEFNSASNKVIAYKDGISKIELNLPAANIGQYLITATTNTLQFNNTTLFTATAGSLVISANTSNGLTGSFLCGFTTGTVTSILAGFNSLPIR
jgi:hypothetical protein